MHNACRLVMSGNVHAIMKAHRYMSVLSSDLTARCNTAKSAQEWVAHAACSACVFSLISTKSPLNMLPRGTCRVQLLRSCRGHTSAPPAPLSVKGMAASMAPINSFLSLHSAAMTTQPLLQLHQQLCVTARDATGISSPPRPFSCLLHTSYGRHCQVRHWSVYFSADAALLAGPDSLLNLPPSHAP